MTAVGLTTSAPGTAPAPHLVLKQVSATYGDTLAVADLNLTVGRGELVALLGPSGCGKTTTLRMVAGFVAPSHGEILLDGRDLARLPPHRRNIGVVFQSYALFPHLTVVENVGFGLRMRGLGREARAARALAALAMVGLEKLAERYPGQLSGGQQQRVALARALVIEPAVLLLDEPLSNLDAGLRADMRAEIRALQQRLSITTLFVTHDQQEALSMSDRVAVMDHGKLVEIGTPQSLCDHPTHAHTAAFLGARTVIEGTAGEGVFRAPGLACSGAPDGATRLVLRAARLRFAAGPAGGSPDGPDGGLDLAGTVSAVAYLGETWEVDVATGAGPIRVIVPSEQTPPPPGSPCRLAAFPGAATFLP